nr:uncharacterized protein LOC123754362 [Procambarus clarkii]
MDSDQEQRHSRMKAVKETRLKGKKLRRSRQKYRKEKFSATNFQALDEEFSDLDLQSAERDSDVDSEVVETVTAVHQTSDCGSARKYAFRPMNGRSFRFRVKAPHNANVCLSGAAAEVPQHMYEIFLAGWNGKESAIRRNKKDDVCKVQTPNLLSSSEFRGFWVVVTNNSIKVRIFTFFFLGFVRITHYGYCTAFGATGSWTFADDDPTHFGPELDLSDLVGALKETTKPSVQPKPSYPSYQQPAPFIGFDHRFGNASSNVFNNDEMTSESPTTWWKSGIMAQELTEGNGATWAPRVGRFETERTLAPSRQRSGRVTSELMEGNRPARASRAYKYKILHSRAPTLALKWVSCRGGSRCPAPVNVTNGVDSPLVALARHNGGLFPGVLMPNINECYITWGGKSISKTDYFLLSNPGNADIIWQSAQNGSVPNGALEGGYSETGEKLYIGRFNVGGMVISGKVHPSHRVCYVPYWGSENNNRRYEVLCLRTVPFTILGIQ